MKKDQHAETDGLAEDKFDWSLKGHLSRLKALPLDQQLLKFGSWRQKPQYDHMLPPADEGDVSVSRWRQTFPGCKVPMSRSDATKIPHQQSDPTNWRFVVGNICSSKAKPMFFEDNTWEIRGFWPQVMELWTVFSTNWSTGKLSRYWNTWVKHGG